MSRLLKDSAVTMLAEVGGALALLVGGVLVARAVGPDGRGMFVLTINVGSMLALLLTFRWLRPTGYFLAQEPANLPAIVGSNLLVAVISVVLAVALWFIYPPSFEDWMLRNAPASIIWLSIVLVGVTSLWQAVTAIYAGLREFALRAWVMLITAVALLIPTVVLFLLGESDPQAPAADRVWPYLLWQVIASVVLYCGWIVHLCIRRRIFPTLDGRLLSRMFRYSTMTFFAVVLDLIMIRLDVFIMNAVLPEGEGLAAVGVYAVAVGLASQLSRVSNILGTVIFSRVAANEMGTGEATARLCRVTLLLTIAGGVALAAAGALLIVPLYGEGFEGAIKPLFILVPAIIAIGQFRILASYIDGRGRPGLVSLCSFVSAVVIVVLDFWWIPHYRAIGAAWASFVSYGVACLAGGIVFSRLTGVPILHLYVPQKADIQAIWIIAQRVWRRGKA